MSCQRANCEPGILWLTLAHSDSDPVWLSPAVTGFLFGLPWLSLSGAHGLTRPLLGTLRRSCVASLYQALASITVLRRLLNTLVFHSKLISPSPILFPTMNFSTAGRMKQPSVSSSTFSIISLAELLLDL